MLVNFYPSDRPRVTRALDLAEKGTKDAATKTTRVGLVAMQHATQLAQIEAARKFFAKATTSDGDHTLSGLLDIPFDLCGVVRIGCFLDLETLGRIRDAMESDHGIELTGDDPVMVLTRDVRGLVGRLGGELDLFDAEEQERREKRREAAEKKREKEAKAEQWRARQYTLDHEAQSRAVDEAGGRALARGDDEMIDESERAAMQEIDAELRAGAAEAAGVGDDFGLSDEDLAQLDDEAAVDALEYDADRIDAERDFGDDDEASEAPARAERVDDDNAVAPGEVLDTPKPRKRHTHRKATPGERAITAKSGASK